MIVLVMGVEGAGKTTVGSLLAEQLHCEFVDGDSFHSAANIQRMRDGIPLTDSDRAPWLASIRKAIAQWLSQGRNVVLACSALKERYRRELLLNEDVKLVYLKATYDLAANRLKMRRGHFAGEQLLAGQFADLEEPADAIVVDASQPPAEIVRDIQMMLLQAR